VESINFSQVQGGKIVVKVGLREPLAATPQGFAVTNPPRIAIDLPNTVNALNRNQIEAGEGDLRSVSIVQTANRTRLVMNLSRNLTYTQSLDGRQLLVTIDASQAPSSGATVATTPSPATVFAEAPAQGTTTRYNLRDVDFRRGPNSEGRIVVDLSSANTGIDIRQQGRQLVLDFINTNVPRNLVRRLDVGDFGTPVRFVDTFEQAGNARMVIEPRGPVGILGLPDRHAVHRRGEAGPRRPEPPGAERHARLRRREALAELPERRSARGAAGHRRLHRA
jgi:type IV pilus assembly protein PilQ